MALLFFVMTSPLTPSLRNVERADSRSLTGSARRVSASSQPADQISQDNYTLWFQNANSRKKKNWQGRGRSVIYLHPGFLATVKRDTCFIWTMKGNVYLSLHPSYCRHSAAFDDCCLLFTLIFIIINQASCPYPPLKLQSYEVLQHSSSKETVQCQWKESTKFFSKSFLKLLRRKCLLISCFSTKLRTTKYKPE